MKFLLSMLLVPTLLFPTPNDKEQGMIDTYIWTHDTSPSAKYPTVVSPSQSDPFEDAMAIISHGQSEDGDSSRISELVKFRAARNQYWREWQSSPLFDTRFLTDQTQTKEFLIHQRGYEEVSFQSDDGLTLAGLYKGATNPKCSVVVASGFFPGRKEGMATYEEIFPYNCNMLFFDFRGHGSSEGSSFNDVFLKKQYGVNEPKDVEAAIKYAHEQCANQPIILMGACSGAFHLVNAVIKMNLEATLNRYNVRGMILDSLWTEMVDAGYSMASDILVGKKAPIYYILSAVYKIFLRGSYREVEQTVNLPQRVQQLPKIPTAVIHGTKDRGVPIAKARSFAGSTSASMHEFDTENPHTLMQIKDKYKYKRIIAQELSRMLQKETTEDREDEFERIETD